MIDRRDGERVDGFAVSRFVGTPPGRRIGPGRSTVGAGREPGPPGIALALAEEGQPRIGDTDLLWPSRAVLPGRFGQPVPRCFLRRG
jgi:hypothetical protein